MGPTPKVDHCPPQRQCVGEQCVCAHRHTHTQKPLHGAAVRQVGRAAAVLSSLTSSGQVFELLKTAATLDLFSTHCIFLSGFQCNEYKGKND